jgi:hypothetical protein
MKARKLQLRKVTVANLDRIELSKVRGGTEGTDTTDKITRYDNTCNPFLCISVLSENCTPTR